MSDRDRIPGSWWFWYYSEALKTGSKCPQFSTTGVKGWFGRKTINSNQIKKEKISVLVFFPDADQRTKSFLRSLSGAFKSAVTIGKNKNNIHVFVTCKDLQQFDEDLKTAPSCSLWSDINGQIADKFGVKPKLEVVDMKSIFSGNDNQEKKYAKRTIPSVFFLMNGEIIKSPAYQPRFQAPNVGTIKGCLEYLERANFNRDVITGEDSFGADMTEQQIKNNQPEAWKEYLKHKQPDDTDQKQNTTPNRGKKQMNETNTSDHSRKRTSGKTKIKKTKMKPKKTTTSSSSSSKHRVSRTKRTKPKSSQNIHKRKKRSSASSSSQIPKNNNNNNNNIKSQKLTSKSFPIHSRL